MGSLHETNIIFSSKKYFWRMSFFPFRWPFWIREPSNVSCQVSGWYVWSATTGLVIQMVLNMVILSCQARFLSSRKHLTYTEHSSYINHSKFRIPGKSMPFFAKVFRGVVCPLWNQHGNRTSTIGRYANYVQYQTKREKQNLQSCRNFGTIFSLFTGGEIIMYYIIYPISLY